jgi:hypothetical protein
MAVPGSDALLVVDRAALRGVLEQPLASTPRVSETIADTRPPAPLPGEFVEQQADDARHEEDR